MRPGHRRQFRAMDDAAPTAAAWRSPRSGSWSGGVQNGTAWPWQAGRHRCCCTWWRWCPASSAVNDRRCRMRSVFHPVLQSAPLSTTMPGWQLVDPALHPPFTLKRDPKTLGFHLPGRPQRKVYLKMFAEGYEYSVLGLFCTRIHMFALPENPAPAAVLLRRRPSSSCVTAVSWWAPRSAVGGLVGVFLSLTIGIVLGGISGYWRRAAGLHHPARDRAGAVAAHHPDLAGGPRPRCRRTAGHAELLHDHADPRSRAGRNWRAWCADAS